MDLFGSSVPDDVGDPAVPEPGRTPPPARAPRTPAPIDLDDWGAAGTTTPSRRWLLVAAIVPWLVVVAVMVTAGRGEPGGSPMPTSSSFVPTPSTTSGPTTAASAPPAPVAVPTAPTAPANDTVVALGGSTGPSTRGQAEGLAVVVARSWLSTRPAGPPVEGLEPALGADSRYVEHLTVESIDHPARGALVVTLRGIILPVDGDVYGAARQVRLAVPIALDADRARPAGAPWLLPAIDPALEAPVGAPVDDVDLMVAAAEAVTAAGYRDVELTSLERTSGWAWLAHVEGRAPGHEAASAHTLWLRSDVGRLVVAGTSPVPPGAPPSAGAPTTPSPTEEVSP